MACRRGSENSVSRSSATLLFIWRSSIISGTKSSRISSLALESWFVEELRSVTANACSRSLEPGRPGVACATVRVQGRGLKGEGNFQGAPGAPTWGFFSKVPGVRGEVQGSRGGIGFWLGRGDARSACLVWKPRRILHEELGFQFAQANQLQKVLATRHKQEHQDRCLPHESHWVQPLPRSPGAMLCRHTWKSCDEKSSPGGQGEVRVMIRI